VDPLIVCVCLAHVNPDFTERAKRSFYSQNYERKHLLLVHTEKSTLTIGANRNTIMEASPPCSYFAHWDYDDVSAPDRLSLQYAHIQKTGKLLTGFYEMAMHDVKNDKTWVYSNEDHRYALGTSLFYRREAWEFAKFPDATPEDNKWRKEIGYDNCESMSGFRADGSPIMVQTVHGGNASAGIYPSSHRYKTATAEQERAVRELLNGTAVRNL